MGQADAQVDVVVVGSGGGGAALGLALAQKGVETLVLEQTLGPPRGLRGEILQPNGQEVMHRLGLLERLPPNAVRPVHRFNFYRAGSTRDGEKRLCTVDYRELPPPYNRALVTISNAVHHVILTALKARAPESLRYNTTVQRLLWEGTRVVGVEAKQDGCLQRVRAQLVVGADGACSKIREALGIQTCFHLYPESYLIAILDDSEGMEEARYFVGRRTVFGVFPAAEHKLYLFDMIPSGSMPQIKADGIEALRRRWVTLDPQIEKCVQSLVSWEQTAYMPTGRVRAKTWVASGAVLIGDAAHAMNPHASQGRMQAMVDAMTLADFIPFWLASGDCSAPALSVFERRRRPQVEMLQQYADEQVFFWNTGNPLVAFLRDRVFRTLDRNRRLRYRVLETTAGLRQTKPLGLLDRLIAAGILPDPWTERADTVVM